MTQSEIDRHLDQLKRQVTAALDPLRPSHTAAEAREHMKRLIEQAEQKEQRNVRRRGAT